MNRDQFDIVGFANSLLRPVLTVADEDLVRFVIADGYDDADRPAWEEFSVDRKQAASILRKHHRDGAYIEKRKARPAKNRYDFLCFPHFYIEPKEPA